jgi:hypothetical protein
MDTRDRDDFYLSKPKDDADDGDEYELEPPDADILAAEVRRGNEAVEATRASIDIDEIYRDADRQRSDEILQNWFRNFKFGFRFQVKHLLIATAVLAIVLTLYQLGRLGTAVVILVMLSVAGLYFYLQWQEKKAQEEASRRRHEMYERRRAAMQKMMSGGDAGAAEASASLQKPTEPLPNETDLAWQEAVSRDKFQFRFRFSMAEMLIAITTAAVIFGLVRILGGPSNTATLLGFAALIGLIIHALGFEPPGIVVLGWWLILVLYVLLSIFAAVLSSFA